MWLREPEMALDGTVAEPSYTGPPKAPHDERLAGSCRVVGGDPQFRLELEQALRGVADASGPPVGGPVVRGDGTGRDRARRATTGSVRTSQTAILTGGAPVPITAAYSYGAASPGAVSRRPTAQIGPRGDLGHHDANGG